MSKKIDVRPIVINDEDYNEKTEPFTYNLPTIKNWSVNNKTRDSSLNDHGIEFTNNSNYHSPSIKTEDDEYIFKSITLTINIDYIDTDIDETSNKRYGFLLMFEKKGFNSDRLYINLPFKLSNTTSPMINTIYDNKNEDFCNESINLNKLIPPNEYISYFYTNDNYEFITFKDTELEIDSAFINKFNQEDDKSDYILKTKNNATFKVSNGIPIEDNTMTSLNSDGMDIYIDCEPVHEKVDNYEIIKPKDVYRKSSIDLYSKVGSYGKPILTMMIFIVICLLGWFSILKASEMKGPDFSNNKKGRFNILYYIIVLFLIVSFIIHSVKLFDTKKTNNDKVILTYITEPPEADIEIGFMVFLIALNLIGAFLFFNYYTTLEKWSPFYSIMKSIYEDPGVDTSIENWKVYGITLLSLTVIPLIILFIMLLNQKSMFPMLKGNKEDKQKDREEKIWLYFFNLVLIMGGVSILCNWDNIFSPTEE